ncbi:MAG: chromosome segregation protein SMC [Chloroflexota bacterium]
MYLSNLEILGFKSFAQKTNFKFSPGLAALVGPNGCGKTNIVDAIRWVLGEQKTAVLRSDSMDNVIFNGTKTRKPLGMAEVALTIDNNRGLLPTEYSQITIARRLFRSGESQYSLNGSLCRLRDITDLFMDTGMGSDSYSVIELKMVEAILSGRFDERRALFEEAAGIKKYKLRRKEATRKLEVVEADLARVEDVLLEVRKLVGSLSRQAAKTKKYNSLLSQLSEIELEVFGREYERFGEARKSLEREIAVNEAEKQGLTGRIEQSERELSQIKTRLEESQQNYREQVAAVMSLQKDLAATKQSHAVTGERIKSARNNKSRLVKEFEEAASRLEGSRNALQRVEFKRAETERQAEEMKKKWEEAVKLRDAASAELTKYREAASAGYRAVSEAQNKISSAESAKKRAEERASYLKKRLEQTLAEKEKSGAAISLIEQDMEKIRSGEPALADALARAEEELAAATARRSELENRAEAVKIAIFEQKNQLSSRRASLDFLTSLVETSDLTRFLLSTPDWKPASGEKIRLAEAVGCDDFARVAVEAALGEAGSYFIAETRAEAEAAVGALRRGKKGKASFICLDMIGPGDGQAPRQALPEELAHGYLIDTLRADGKLTPLLETLLGRAAFAKSLEAAEKLVAQGKASRAITPAGEIVSREGVYRAGSEMKNEGALVGKKERIDKLRAEIQELNRSVVDHEAEGHGLRRELAAIDLSALQKAVRLREQSIAESKQKIASLELKKQSAASSEELLNQNADRFTAELADTDGELEKINAETTRFSKELADARSEHERLNRTLNSAEAVARDKSDAARRGEIEYVQISSEVKNLLADSKRIENQIQGTERRLDSFASETRAADEEARGLESQLAELERRVGEVTERLDVAETSRSLALEKNSSLETDYEAASSELNDLRRAENKSKEALHERQLKLGEINGKLENLVARAREAYQIELDGAEIPRTENFSIEEAKNLLADLKQKLSALGSVNFMALEEFDEQSARLELYETQVKDLKEAEKTLRETIDEINKTAEQNFLATFNQIRDNFKMLFQKLFGPEGFADINLNEGNLLEADIEVTAQPPNKRPHSIEMLSGGEKTLTAIALLFGIYLVKPSPFCILDEVDAPLDDANIDKFITLIKEFSDRTQFLIVTHNKKTMEAAETLYGVTMQEEGVSKVVSVRLDGATETRA